MYWGFDLSLNHGAAVALRRNGTLSLFYYVTQIKKQHFKEPLEWPDYTGHSIYFPITKLHKETKEDLHLRAAIKLEWWRRVFKLIFPANVAEIIGIEDYAYGKSANIGSLAIAEVTGLLKSMCLSSNVPMRLHDPKTVKMFGTLTGNADPDEVSDAAQEMFPGLVSVPRVGMDNSPWHDVGAAYWVARLVWIESQLRDGAVLLTDLHAKQRQAFLRATKNFPTNLLGREWTTVSQVTCYPEFGGGA